MVMWWWKNTRARFFKSLSLCLTFIWEAISFLLLTACWALIILLLCSNASLWAAGLMAPWRRLWTTSVYTCANTFVNRAMFYACESWAHIQIKNSWQLTLCPFRSTSFYFPRFPSSPWTCQKIPVIFFISNFVNTPSKLLRLIFGLMLT